jgi:hypothetical protein
MASNYFENFKNTLYNQSAVKNILVRNKFLEQWNKNDYASFQFELKHGDRPDTVAYDYYGDSKYAWVVCLTNNIIDPIYDWYLSDIDFDSFISDKYGNIATAMSTIIYYKNNWAYDDTKLSSAAYQALDANQKKYWDLEQYYSSSSPVYKRKQIDWQITPGAYAGVYTTDPKLSTEKIYYSSVDQYTDELEKNEQKRFIKLISKIYLNDLEKNLRDIINGN